MKEKISNGASENQINIFTDGASRGNPGPGGWGVVIAMRDDTRTDADLTRNYAEKERVTITELGGREKLTTNNRMELRAVVEALSFLFESYKLEARSHKLLLYSDSGYVINGITKWIVGWQARDWKTLQKEDVANKDLWQELLDLTRKFENIEWKLLGGHVGVVGNERCDEIATLFADGKNPTLYKGPLRDYGRDILNSSHDVTKHTEKKGKSARSGMKAYSYLSLLDGKVERHLTWKECEARVKGRPAKFKKAISAEDEKAILKEWKVHFPKFY